MESKSEHYYLRLWIFRILVPLGGHSEWLGQHGVRTKEVARAIGLGHWVDDPRYSYTQETALVELRKAHQEAEATCTPVKVLHPLPENAARIASLIGLSDIEIQLLQFLVLLHHDLLLGEIAEEYISGVGDTRAYRVLAAVLGLPESAVRAAFTSRSRLILSGLVKVNHDGPMPLRCKFDLIEGGFAEEMLRTFDDPINIFKNSFRLAPPSTLALDDYEHVRPTLDILVPHMRKAIANGSAGVNTFIYGQPGTGKSQLARVIAALLGVNLFEVSGEDQDGDPIDGEQRLRAYRVAQTLLTGQTSLLAFDESEDIFGQDELFLERKSAVQSQKAWVNRTLEENRVPCIWISNSVHNVDPAFLRRFDVVMELGIPPKKQRLRIVRSACENLIDERAMTRLAEFPQISPAVVTRAACVIRAVGDDLDESEVLPALTRLIDGTLIAQGHRALGSTNVQSLPDYYDPAFLNVGADLEEIAAGIARTGSARLCLYGPSGTGKSAFGRWLADRLNKPLHEKRVSDLVSRYIGKTERNLAIAFHEAATEKAVLLLDEVDSFLQDRQKAGRSWEVTEVNEMLTQMESFEGILVASTNLIDGLDQAALRRFDLKLQFGYLRSEQAWRLFERQALALGLGQPGPDLKSALNAFTHLTPGDFAAVARQSRFRSIVGCKGMLDALAAECRTRDGGNRNAIGFL